MGKTIDLRKACEPLDVNLVGDDVDNTMRFIDEILPSRYFRICVKDNGVTTGTIDAIMYLKRK